MEQRSKKQIIGGGDDIRSMEGCRRIAEMWAECAEIDYRAKRWSKARAAAAISRAWATLAGVP